MPLAVVDSRTGKATTLDLPEDSPQPASSSFSPSISCATCKKAASSASPLKICAICLRTPYCSRECRQADWKSHKKDCIRPTPLDATSIYGQLTVSVLHSVPKTDVCRRLIDSFRLRVEDTYTFEGKLTGIYGGEDPLPQFVEFLTKCEEHAKEMMPPWWGPEAKRDCTAMASDKNGGNYVGHAVEKADIQEKYGDDMMPFKLRVLSEKAYRRRIMG